MRHLNLNRLSFLVVEDNAFMRKLLISMLQACNVGNIESATDGIKAFKLMRDGFSPDLILTDMKMPVMGGLEFTRWVRSADEVAKKDVPIILVTAFADAETVVAARDAGVDEFLAKPVSADDLLLRIRNVIEAKRPYVASSKYAGPDRRRRQARIKGRERRKTKGVRQATKGKAVFSSGAVSSGQEKPPLL